MKESRRLRRRDLTFTAAEKYARMEKNGGMRHAEIISERKEKGFQYHL